MSTETTTGASLTPSNDPNISLAAAFDANEAARQTAPDSTQTEIVTPSAQTTEQPVNAQQATDPDEEAISSLPLHLQPRGRELVTQKNEFRTQAEQARARAAELEAENTRLKRWEPIHERFASQGFDDPDKILSGLTQEEERGRQAVIAQGYLRRVNSGELTQDVAEQMFQQHIKAELSDADRAFIADMRATQAIEAAKGQFPEADVEMVKAMHSKTGAPIAELMQSSHQSRLAYRQRVESELAAAQQQRAAQQQPVMGNAGAAVAPKSGPMSLREIFAQTE
jgi:hypothetical protein